MYGNTVRMNDSKHRQCFGGHSERETPGHIPNPEAKTLSADGTAGVTLWESRTPPDFLRGRATHRWVALSSLSGTEALGACASPPEFGELTGEGCSLVVAGSRCGRPQRLIHRVGTEQVLGAAVGHDGLDSAPVRAQFVDLRGKMHPPLQRRPRSAAQW